MKYRFKPTQRFWESFYALTPTQKDSTRRAWKIFKENPFDARLRSHKIHKLSARYGRTVYAVEIEANLRVAFYVEGDSRNCGHWFARHLSRLRIRSDPRH